MFTMRQSELSMRSQRSIQGAQRFSQIPENGALSHGGTSLARVNRIYILWRRAETVTNFHDAAERIEHEISAIAPGGATI